MPASAAESTQQERAAALADPDTTADHVVIIVGAEPRLAARILQTANSAAFNTSGKPLTDLRSAITRLGHQMVHGTAMSYAMQQMKNEATLRTIAQPLTELWNKSIAVASLCRIIAGRTQVSTDEAFLTGLLHGIGNLRRYCGCGLRRRTQRSAAANQSGP